MVAAGTHGAVWAEDATDAVGELHDVSDAVAAAVVFPGPALVLPTSTMRNLSSLAVLRLRRGRVWVISVIGYRWTAERLALVADALQAHGEVDPDAVLLNRLSDQLGLPNIRVARPTMSELDGTAWNVRSLAVAVGLARVFASGSAAGGAITSAEVDDLAVEIRSTLSDAMARFRSGLDSDALERCKDYGESAPRVYNYLVITEHRRNRQQFASVLPLFLQAVALRSDESPYREMRQAVDAGHPLAALVCRTIGVGPSVFRSVVGVPIDVCGSRWLDSPVALLRLINSIRPERRPGEDPARWVILNRLVEKAETLIGRRIEQSLVAQMWVRDAMHAGAGTCAVGSASDIDTRALAIVEDFREVLFEVVGGRQPLHAKSARRATDDGLRQVTDDWLLRRTRRQLVTLAVQWRDAYAKAKDSNANLIACMHGELYWPLLPSPFTSTDGRRRAVPVVSRQQLADLGSTMANCLGGSHAQSYDAACRSGATFLLALVDGESGAPRSTAEFKVGRLREGAGLVVEVVQHTARRNAAPGPACVTMMHELTRHVESQAVQRHLRLGVTAVRAVRRQGAVAISSAELETRLRALKQVLGDQLFEDLWQRCEQARGSPGALL